MPITLREGENEAVVISPLSAMGDRVVSNPALTFALHGCGFRISDFRELTNIGMYKIFYTIVCFFRSF